MNGIINGTFNIPNGANITNSVNTNVQIKGNGIALGITDGVNNMSLGSADSVANSPRTCSQYGATVGTLAKSYTGSDDKTLGITTDASKSGIVGTVTRSIMSARFVIKY